MKAVYLPSATGVTLVKRLLWACLLLAACLPAVPTPEPTPGFVPSNRLAPTPTPPPWTDGVEPVTLENAGRIARLGRLDAQTAPSTVFAYALAPDSARLAGLNNEQLIVWDLLTGGIVFNTARAEALHVYYAPDKNQVYTVDGGGAIALYDAASGAQQDALDGHAAFNGAAAYHPDTGWLALGGRDGEVKVWDVAARRALVALRAHRLQVAALAFSADGSQLATAGEDGQVQVWDWQNRERLATVDGQALRLAFAPGGRQLAVGEADAIRLYTLPDGELARTLATGPGGASDVLAYSPDGRYLINGGGLPALTVYDADDGQLVAQLPGVGGDRTAAVFSPDGQLLATSVLGGGVSLWDMTRVSQGELARGDLAAGTLQVLAVDWTPDSFALLVFEATGPVQVWGIPAAPAS